MRSTAILLVLICHLLYSIKSITFPHVLSGYLGFYGVEIFFVLSGFLIGNIAIRSELTGAQFLKDFWIKRWFRTLPNYFIFLFLYIYLSKVDLQYCNKYFFFMQNFTSPHPRLFSQAWSLAIEEWFYLLLPILILSSRAIVKKKMLADLLCIALFILLITIHRSYAVFNNDLDWNSELRTVVIYRLDALMFGVLSAWYEFYFSFHFNTLKILKSILGLMGLAISIALCHPSLQPLYVSKAFSFSLVSFSIVLLLPSISSLRLKNSRLRNIVYRISLYSYTIYLCHFQWQFIIQKQFLRLFPADGFLYDIAFSLIYLASTLIFSAAWYHLVEIKVTQQRNFFLKK
jgi:peptidoglycan/LPS O-acetylase OafA/YrhL